MSDILKISKTIKVKHKFNNHLCETPEESIHITKLENFVKKYYIMVSQSFEDYINGNKPSNKKIYISHAS